MKKIRKKEFTQFLENALKFDIWIGSDRETDKEARDYIFDKIGETYRNARKKDKDKDREALLVILLNLWIGFFVGRPIRISMNSKNYSRNRVYDKEFFKYRRIKRLIDSLERHGYIQKKLGFCDNCARQTRIWATIELIKIFIDEYKFRIVGDIHYTESDHLVQLRNEFKVKNEKTGKSMKVSEDVEIIPSKKTEAMESNIKKINALATEKKITVCLNEDDKVSLEDLIGEILPDLIKGKIRLIDAGFIETKYELPSNITSVHGKNSHSMSSNRVNQSTQINSNSDAGAGSVDANSAGADIEALGIEVFTYKKFSYPVALYRNLINLELNSTQFYSTITNNNQSYYYQGIQSNEALFLHFLWIKKLLTLIKSSKKKDKLIEEERPLADFGIKTLEFEIKNNFLHRVFNRASQNLDKGGRFYGAYHLGMPKQFRKSIQINGNETVELDFGGLHIRMLYHELEKEFEGDPYTINDGVIRSKEEQDEIREMYKLVSLISINAKKQGAHIAVRDALEDAGFDTGNDISLILNMMDNFKVKHKDINEFLFSGVGIDLQNKDSLIMGKILMRLHEKEICGLPVHDSVICEKEHSDYLYKIMMEEYEKEMGYVPVLK